MLDPKALINRVNSYLQHELKPAALTRGKMLTITLPVPEVYLRSLPATKEDWFFWDRPSEDEVILGLGQALNITASGKNRFEILNQKMLEIQNDWECIDLEQTGCPPLGHLCFAFDPDDQMTNTWKDLPNSSLSLPELTLQQRNNNCIASFSVNLENDRGVDEIRQRWMLLFTGLITELNNPPNPPGCKTILSRIIDSSDREQWGHLVNMAKSSISAKNVEKVVPARHLRVQAERKIDPRQLMSTLNYLYPNSTLIAFKIGKRIFVSATPERLASLHNGTIVCDATAGTIHRSAVEEQDLDLGKHLLSDPKVRHEHRLVVEDISSSLQPICHSLEYHKQPVLLRLRGLQHLFTEIKGKIKPDINLLQAASKLHPTAAVNGYPNDQAGQWLKQHEPFDRGWYAGAAGWIDCCGNGELAVLLRCALLDQDQADLYAGAGITNGSDADAEFSETELKFSVMLEALENA